MIQKCVDLIAGSQFLVALTGAGISTQAGIPDFRGPKGLYTTQKYDPDTIFDIQCFHQDPEPFYEFAKEFVVLEETLEPTIAHKFLTYLEEKGTLKGIITQNIDALQQRSGAKNVLEMHGSFWKSFCLDCFKEFSYVEMKARVLEESVVRCECGGVVKPDVVFFGENVKFMEEAGCLAQKADVLLVVGTSCVVYPAASIPSLTNGKIIVINQGDVNIYNDVFLHVREDIDEFLEKVWEGLLNLN